MIKRSKRLSHKILAVVVATLCIVSAISLGFSSWSITYPDSIQANLQLVVNDVTGKFVQFKDVSLSNKTIRFDASDDKKGNVTIGNDEKTEQLSCEIVGTLGKYSTFKEINVSISADSHYEQEWKQLYQKGYFEIPKFISLSRYSDIEDNGESVTTFWTTAYDSKTDERSFCIRSTFSWGQFFNYKNPCDFFDSNDNNGIKKGNEYSFQEKKAILNELKLLDGSKFVVTLSSKPFKYETYVTYDKDGDLTKIKLLDNIIDDGILHFPDVPADTDSPIGGTFNGWKLSNGKEVSTTTYEANSTTNIDLDFFNDTNKIYIIATWRYDIDIPATKMTVELLDSAGAVVATADTENNTLVNYSLGSDEGTLTIRASFTPHNASKQEINVEQKDTHDGLIVTIKELNIELKNNKDADITTTIIVNSASNDRLKVEFSITVKEKSCILPTTRILMSDGTYKSAKDIVANDKILVMNHETGNLESAPIFYNFHYEKKLNVITSLRFSNDIVVDISGNHGFFDVNENKYVYLNETNAKYFIGHSFISCYDKQLSKTTLLSVSVREEWTDLYCPVSVFHLNYFVEDLLSMPGGIDGCFNIFDYDDNLKYDVDDYNDSISKYGLMQYEECEKFIPRFVFDSLPMKYMNVAIGKGLLTMETLKEYMEHFYSIMNE